MKILIIEDNDTDAMATEYQLLKLEPQPVVHRACTLEQALQILARNAYDALIVDLTLSDSAGEETYNACKEACGHAAMVVLSASNHVEVRRMVARDGNVYALKSRFDETTLLDDLRAALLKRQGMLLTGEANG